MHQATRAGNVEIAKAILPIDICSHRRCAQAAKLFKTLAAKREPVAAVSADRKQAMAYQIDAAASIGN